MAGTKGTSKAATNASKTKKAPATKPKKGKKNKPIDDEGVDDESEPEPEDKEPVKVSIDWKDESLTWKMITAIEDDSEMKGKLFPPVGPNPRKKGGTPKTEYQFLLAQRVFEDHETYGPSIKNAVTARQKKPWISKIKNRLKNLQDTTREQMKEMGQTGAGIDKATEIEPGTAFSTKWEEIKAVSPWFFNMRALISDRPNLVPMGLGNSSTTIDLSLLGDDDRSSSPAGEEVNPIASDESSEDSSSEEDKSSGSDSLPETLLEQPRKRKKTVAKVGADKEPAVEQKVESKVKAVKKTKASKGKSEPAAKPPPAKKARTAIDQFKDIADASERTIQKGYELKKSKVKSESAVEIAKIKAQAEVKMEESRLKNDLAKEKMRQDHEFRMAEMKFAATAPVDRFRQPSQSHFPSSSRGHPSSHRSSQYSQARSHANDQSYVSGASQFGGSAPAHEDYTPVLTSQSGGSSPAGWGSSSHGDSVPYSFPDDLANPDLSSFPA